MGGAGILPLIFLARLAVASFVAWAIVGLDASAILRAFLVAFGVCFLLLFGWYFAILGYDDAIFYLAVSADLLYLIGALLVGSTLVLSALRTRSRNDHLKA